MSGTLPTDFDRAYPDKPQECQCHCHLHPSLSLEDCTCEIKMIPISCPHCQNRQPQDVRQQFANGMYEARTGESMSQKPEKQECYCKYDKDGKQFGLCLRCMRMKLEARNKVRQEIRDAFKKWKKQGRTKEQIWAVENFLSGEVSILKEGE